MPELTDYCLAHDEMFVVPIEHLSPAGISMDFRARLSGRVSAEWNALFNAAFALYWERTADLAARAPRDWFPPRVQHVCIVTEPSRVRPYFQPFNKSSWLLYASDFDPATSNREFAAYQFLHVERMGLLQEVTQPVIRNLSYWLVRSDDEVAQFCDACRRTPRPDAPAFWALAEAMPWIRRLHHEPLKPPRLVSLEPTQTMPNTGLLVPRSVRPRIDDLTRRWTMAATRAVDAFRAIHARRGRDRTGEFCAWLQATQPLALLTTEGGRTVWDPDCPDQLREVRSVVGGIGEAAMHRIRDDIAIIDRGSRAFLASLRDPDALPRPHADTAQNGLSYLHRERKLIAYNLREPAMDRLSAPAPPYERFMLAARTIHEWGHLVVDAGWVPVPPDRKTRHDQLCAELAERFEAVVRDAPAAMRSLAAREIARLQAEAGGVGRGLARIPLARMPDYQANLLARRYLSAHELETYVRNNVYSLTMEYPATKLFQRLARYVYEYQYLRLIQIADPGRYFLSSTWFAQEYLQTQILDEACVARLLETLAAICDAYVIDDGRFVSASPSGREPI